MREGKKRTYREDLAIGILLLSHAHQLLGCHHVGVIEPQVCQPTLRGQIRNPFENGWAPELSLMSLQHRQYWIAPGRSWHLDYGLPGKCMLL